MKKYFDADNILIAFAVVLMVSFFGFAINAMNTHDKNLAKHLKEKAEIERLSKLR